MGDDWCMRLSCALVFAVSVSGATTFATKLQSWKICRPTEQVYQYPTKWCIFASALCAIWPLKNEDKRAFLLFQFQFQHRDGHASKKIQVDLSVWISIFDINHVFIHILLLATTTIHLYNLDYWQLKRSCTLLLLFPNNNYPSSEILAKTKQCLCHSALGRQKQLKPVVTGQSSKIEAAST